MWTVVVACIMAVMALPIVTVILLAIFPKENIWPHLATNVLFGRPPTSALLLAALATAGFIFRALRPTAPAAPLVTAVSVAAVILAVGQFPGSVGQTVMLMTGAGLLTIATGTSAAWLVTMYRFPGRSIADRLLVIPLAIPTYIIAYAYVDLLDYSGPVQTAVRAIFGFESARDYWFPEMRSIGGAVFVMSAVLYPYVYLTARASFVQQSVCALEVARTLGRTPLGVFWAVALPLARPALIAGVSLVLMECLNDIGAVEYLGVQTLTASVYSTWLQRSNLGGAAQIAMVMLGFIVLLFAAERMARGAAQVHHTTGRYRSIPFHELSGWERLRCFRRLPAAVHRWIPASGFGAHKAGAWRQCGHGLRQLLVCCDQQFRFVGDRCGRRRDVGADAWLCQTGRAQRLHPAGCECSRSWICSSWNGLGSWTAYSIGRHRQSY
jgi:iron(III) transport system permease protein